MTDAQMKSLVRASSELVRHLDEDVVIQSIIKEACSVVDAESCAVILVDALSDECFFYDATGPNQDVLRKIRFQKELGFAGQVLKSGRAELVQNAEGDPKHYRGVDEQTGLETKSLVCTPLKMGRQTIGVVEAINKQGAPGFSKQDLQLLTIFTNYASLAISNARAFGRCRHDADAFRLAADRGDVFLGESPAMQSVWRIIRKVAPTNATVLVTGESGTGKEVVASAIHRQSPRRERPYICVNCAALEANLLTSELFGHEKGAFTGATSRRTGRFELANGGTLFLDEIADTEPAFQASLLRVLEAHEFERLGGSQTVHTDARVIAATNQDLSVAVAENRFREDLYHRLNVVSVHVPPLRDRRTDVGGLVDHFAGLFAAEMNTRPVLFEDDALGVLTEYPWPGNIRELKNLVERVMVLADTPSVSLDELLCMFPQLRETAGDFPRVGTPSGTPNSLWDAERVMIEDALAANNWNQSKTARALGITRHHLRYRIKKYGIVKS